MGFKLIVTRSDEGRKSGVCKIVCMSCKCEIDGCYYRLNGDQFSIYKVFEDVIGKHDTGCPTLNVLHSSIR